MWKKIRLAEGKNIISIKVTNSGCSEESEIEINYEFEKQKRIALVIGNSKYINGGTPKNPVNDVTDIAE